MAVNNRIAQLKNPKSGHFVKYKRVKDEIIINKKSEETSLGTAKEIILVINYYGAREVVDVLKGINYIDPKTLNFVSKLFNISLQSFKCYTRKQLNPQHWNS